MSFNISGLIDLLKQQNLFVSASGDWQNIKTQTVSNDTRTLQSGDVFACISGANYDSHKDIDKIISSGASALLIEKNLGDLPVPTLQVTDARAAAGFLASALKDHPSSKLRMTAVTGTNGKSTTTFMIRHILSNAQTDGKTTKCGLIGTIIYDNGRQALLADRTTPEGVQLQNYLSEMLNNNCTSCSIECSSHGIEQGRINGMKFDGAVFTNLTPEHLDYHINMENYYQAKKKLFTQYLKPNGVCAINTDDVYGARLAWELKQNKNNTITFAITSQANLTASDIQITPQGSSFQLNYNAKHLGQISLPLPGNFNIHNALGAAALCIALGINIPDIINGLNTMQQVPGRMEKLTFKDGRIAIIDYAHTPDALQKLLTAVKQITQTTGGKLISIYGHGGNRVADFRPQLGRIGAQLADSIIVTMDNPRFEDPTDIANQIIEGIKSVKNGLDYTLIIDRKEAINFALSNSKKGDIVVISGKGPEPYLEIKGIKHPYSDKETVEQWARSQNLL